MIRALVKLALTYAVTKAVARAGGPGAILNSVLASGKKRGGHAPRHNSGRRGRH